MNAFTSKPVVIHVGLIKTGTTALQCNVFSRCPGVLYLGKPATPSSARARRLFTTLAYADAPTWDAHGEVLSDDLATLLRTDEPRILLSAEELSVGSADGLVKGRDVAPRIHRLFPESRIVVVIRSQLTAFQSLYAFWRERRGPEEPAFNAWMRALASAPPPRHDLAIFDHAGLVAVYDDLWGEDRVDVLLYEDFRDDPSAFVSRLLTSIGVDPSLASSFPNAAHNARSGRVSDADLAYAPEVERLVRDRHAPGNARLAASRGLDLAARGYPT